MPEHRPDAVTPVLRAAPAIDRLIHEPVRYHIMVVFHVIEIADFLFLRNQTGMTEGNLSSHLSRIEKAGHVQLKKEFIGKKTHTSWSSPQMGGRPPMHTRPPCTPTWNCRREEGPVSARRGCLLKP